MQKTSTKISDQYFFDGKYLFHTGHNKKISNFYLIPARTYCLNNDMLPRFCDIELVRGDGINVLLAKRVELSQLTPAFWKDPPPGCYYCPGIQTPHRYLEALFQTLLNDLDPIQVHQPAALGWWTLPSGEHVYVTGSGVIGPNGYLPSETTWIPASLATYQLETSPQVSEMEALQYFWTVFSAIPGITDILLVNTLSSFLIPCFKAAGIWPRFPIILEGLSESKKTTLACLTSGLYNRKTAPRSCIGALTSTSRALELKGSCLRHATLVFDDLFPDGGNTQERKALELIRDLANQTPRETRSGKTLVGTEMECGAVFTAEKFPDCGKSTRTRCLRLVLSDPVPNNILSPLQESSEWLSNVFFSFISYISKFFDAISTEIESDFRLYRKIRATPDAETISSERLAEIGFILYTTLKIFLKLDLNISNTEYLVPFERQLNQWLAWQLSPQAMSGYNFILSAIAQLVKSCSNEFICLNGYYCIKPKQLVYLLRWHCKDERITEQEVNALLRNNNLLAMDKSGVATKKIKGYGRCLHIDQRRLLRNC